MHHLGVRILIVLFVIFMFEEIVHTRFSAPLRGPLSFHKSLERLSTMYNLLVSGIEFNLSL